MNTAGVNQWKLEVYFLTLARGRHGNLLDPAFLSWQCDSCVRLPLSRQFRSVQPVLKWNHFCMLRAYPVAVSSLSGSPCKAKHFLESSCFTFHLSVFYGQLHKRLPAQCPRRKNSTKVLHAYCLATQYRIAFRSLLAFRCNLALLGIFEFYAPPVPIRRRTP